FRCFPHIVNLACKAMLREISDMDFAAKGPADFVPPQVQAATFMDVIEQDPVATVRTVVRVIWASSLRHQYFSQVLKALEKKYLQLLQDVDTRWSSTLLMIEHALLLCEAINKFLSDNQFEDLRKYKLGDVEWDALEYLLLTFLQVPHAFQQTLSVETTPTLGDALPTFEAMIQMWEKQQTEHPETSDIMQKGIDKLSLYQERVEDVPTCILAMSEICFSLCTFYH
ncbi:hypothetical protein B0H10DRAFT_1802927, partial [Mycena sp. CBHHK59/15]